MSWWKKIAIGFLVLIALGGGIVWYGLKNVEVDAYTPSYMANCSSCHGADLEGTERAIALIGSEFSGGDRVDQIGESIRHRHTELGQPAFADALTDVQVKGLAIYIAERRLGQKFIEFQFHRDIQIPAHRVSSEAHDFVVETFAEGLDPLVFSIEPMPDGAWLVTEKERGLSIVNAEGEQSDVIEGTPDTGYSMDVYGIQYGWGWLLDVTLHPDYEENGWVYLHYTDLCGDACDGMTPSTMNRVDRGRIVDGRWVDVEPIWQMPHSYYQNTVDTAAGGRLAHDASGHVYIGVGASNEDGSSDVTPQDLTLPYGKIHRVRDDGTIPLDNPFYVAGADEDADRPLPSIWSYGHRSPQGLEWHPGRGRAWNSEMGPRGGDELNELLPGHNYGWPFHSLGLEYEMNRVERHKRRNIEFDASEVEQTLVDITPSPAISSFVVYDGAGFPGWQGNVLIGSLKGMSLFRMVFEGNRLVHQETVIKDLARIRDIEVGYDGLVYLLLESGEGSSIVRLRPQDETMTATR